MARSKRLGRGLESLLSQEPYDEGLADAGASPASEIAIDEIQPNPFQPRRDFDESALEELAASIREHGLLQPVLVRPSPEGSGYHLIAGERRWRASRKAGLTTVPALVREFTDDDALTVALVENIQREDLNPVEKARAFRDMADRFGLTQEEIASRTGKDRSTVANFMRLLDLPETVLELVSRGTLGMGHARALLGLGSADEQVEMCKAIVRNDLSVRDVERSVASKRPGKHAAARKQAAKSAYVRDLEDRVRERLGLKVALDARSGRGKLTIRFANDGEFQRLLDALGIEGEG